MLSCKCRIRKSCQSLFKILKAILKSLKKIQTVETQNKLSKIENNFYIDAIISILYVLLKRA